MIVLMIGGKIAPRPSLFRRRSWIHASLARSARLRSGRRRSASAALRTRSVAVKNVFQSRAASDVEGFFGALRPVKSSGIAARSGTAQLGLCAQRIESGTTIPRDHDDIL